MCDNIGPDTGAGPSIKVGENCQKISRGTCHPTVVEKKQRWEEFSQALNLGRSDAGEFLGKSGCLTTHHR
jgi:hypothetical protein